MRWKKREGVRAQARTRDKTSKQHWSTNPDELLCLPLLTQLLPGHMEGKKKPGKRAARSSGRNLTSFLLLFLLSNSTSFFLFCSSTLSFFTLSLALSLSPAPALSIGFSCCPVWRDPIKAADFGVQLELSHRIFHADNTRPKLSTSSLASHPDLNSIYSSPSSVGYPTPPPFLPSVRSNRLTNLFHVRFRRL